MNVDASFSPHKNCFGRLLAFFEFGCLLPIGLNVLSVLSLAIHVLSDSRSQQQARKRLMEISPRLAARGHGATLLPAFSPQQAGLLAIPFSVCVAEVFIVLRVRNPELRFFPRRCIPSGDSRSRECEGRHMRINLVRGRGQPH